MTNRSENVGIVIVSHSPLVAQGTADMVRQMVGEGVPLADTEKVALAPAFTVWPEGWAEIEGAMVAGLTVKVAPLLVAEPAELVATTVYVPAFPALTLPIL